VRIASDARRPWLDRPAKRLLDVYVDWQSRLGERLSWPACGGGEGGRHRRLHRLAKGTAPPMPTWSLPRSLADLLDRFGCCFTAPTFTTLPG
jgi:hypothetical protein